MSALSLRARLLIGLGVLAAFGLAAAGIATYEEQRSFLFTRVDQQVGASQFLVAGQLGVLKGAPPGLPRRIVPPPTRRATTFQASGTYGELLGAGGKVLKVASFAYGQGTASPPSLPSRPRALETRG